MVRRASHQTASVLAALAGEPQTWRYGYELGKQVGLQAGTLYPILMRLGDRGLLEARWEPDPPLGRPRRHLYQLTAAGRSVAAEVQAAVLAPMASTRAPRWQETALGGAG